MEQNVYAKVTTYQFPLNTHSITNNDDDYAKIRVTDSPDTVWFSVEDICKATGTIPQHILRDIDPTDLATFITYNGQEKIETEIDMVSFNRIQTVFSKSGRPRAIAFFEWVESVVLFDKRISYAAKAVFVVVKGLKCKSGEDIKAYCKDDYLTIFLSVKELVAAGHLKDGEVTL